MKQYKFAFCTTEKTRTRRIAAHLAAGARSHGDIIDIVPAHEFNVNEYDGALKIGISLGTRRIMDVCAEHNKQFFYIDKDYFGGPLYWRVSVDGWQPLKYFRRFKRSSDRFEQLGIKIYSNRGTTSDSHILLAGACQNYNTFMSLGDITEYNTHVVKQIKRVTNRPIVYRPNPAWARKHSPEEIHIPGTILSLSGTFADCLDDCHLVVSHGSSVLVEALRLGVPIMTMGEGVAVEQGITDFEYIERPVYPTMAAKYQFFHDLAYCQWTIPEYRSGEAWADLRLTLAYLNSTPADVIEQYQVMHKSEKYFRGLCTVKHKDVICSMIDTHNATNLLDYGSGKGKQYEFPYSLQNYWGVAVHCYDPGVPEFLNIPIEKYDGVICCDVMEHVPETEVRATLQRIFGYARRFVFLSIATVPATKSLPDGRNCHLTVRPRKWWEAQIAAVNTNSLDFVLVTGDEDE